VKNPYDQFDKTLEHRVRLQIMSVLVANDSYDFSSLKELLGVTDGNLASHLKTLEAEKYIQVKKSFVDRKPNTRYRVSEKGRQSFRKHLEAMAEVVKLDLKALL
jgi:DNA-binding MarR family transcriptional regulator